LTEAVLVAQGRVFIARAVKGTTMGTDGERGTPLVMRSENGCEERGYGHG